MPRHGRPLGFSGRSASIFASAHEPRPPYDPQSPLKSCRKGLQLGVGEVQRPSWSFGNMHVGTSKRQPPGAEPIITPESSPNGDHPLPDGRPGGKARGAGAAGALGCSSSDVSIFGAVRPHVKTADLNLCFVQAPTSHFERVSRAPAGSSLVSAGRIFPPALWFERNCNVEFVFPLFLAPMDCLPSPSPRLLRGRRCWRHLSVVGMDGVRMCNQPRPPSMVCMVRGAWWGRGSLPRSVLFRRQPTSQPECSKVATSTATDGRQVQRPSLNASS